MNLLKHWSDLAQFVHSRFVTRWNVLRSSESSGLGSRLPCEIHYKARSHRRRKGRRRSYLLIRCFKHFRGLVPCLRAPQECSEIAPAPILQPSQYPIVLSKTETQTSLPGQTHAGWTAAETSTIHSTFSLNSVLIGLDGLVWDEWWEQLDLCNLNRLHKVCYKICNCINNWHKYLFLNVVYGVWEFGPKQHLTWPSSKWHFLPLHQEWKCLSRL